MAVKKVRVKTSQLPTDYVKGSKVVGEKYNAFNTYGQGTPDFGASKGPGDPYHVVQKTMRANTAKPTPWRSVLNSVGTVFDRNNPPAGGVRFGSNGTYGENNYNARVAAIRKRLGWK